MRRPSGGRVRRGTLTSRMFLSEGSSIPRLNSSSATMRATASAAAMNCSSRNFVGLLIIVPSPTPAPHDKLARQPRNQHTRNHLDLRTIKQRRCRALVWGDPCPHEGHHKAHSSRAPPHRGLSQVPRTREDVVRRGVAGLVLPPVGQLHGPVARVARRNEAPARGASGMSHGCWPLAPAWRAAPQQPCSAHLPSVHVSASSGDTSGCSLLSGKMSGCLHAAAMVEHTCAHARRAAEPHKLSLPPPHGTHTAR